MPAPAGFQPVASPGQTPAGFQPISIADAYAQQSGSSSSGSPDRISQLIQNSPVGMVKGLADAIRADVQNPKETGSGIVQMMKSNAGLWDRTKADFKAGNYGKAAVHFLDYILPGGQAVSDIGDTYDAGDPTGAALKTVGLASNALVPDVMDAATSPTAARIPSAVAAGVKAAAPDVAMGAAKMGTGVALGEAVPHVGMLPRLLMEYPGARQVGKGLKTGAEAFKSALADKVTAATETANAESSDPILNGLAGIRTKGGSFNDLNSADQQQVRDMAQQFRDAGSARATVGANPGTPETAVAPPQPSAIPAAAPQEALLDKIAQAGVFGKKYRDFSSAPVDAQRTIRGVVAGMTGKAEKIRDIDDYTDLPSNVQNLVPGDEDQEKAITADLPAPGVSRETSPPAQTVQQMMRAVPDEAARAEFMRQREAGQSAPRSVADGMYAQGKQTQAEAAETYQAAARTDKAVKLATALNSHNITHAELAAQPAAKLVEMLKPAAKALGINAPSTATIPEVLFHLERLEAAKPGPVVLPPTGGQ